VRLLPVVSSQVLIYVIAIDSSLSDNFGRSIIYALSATTTLVTVSVVGGLPFVVAILILSAIYWNGKLLLFLLFLSLTFSANCSLAYVVQLLRCAAATSFFSSLIEHLSGLWSNFSRHAAARCVKIHVIIIIPVQLTCYRFGYPFATVFHLRRDYFWSHHYPRFRCLDQISEGYVAICRYGVFFLPFVATPASLTTSNRTRTRITGCSEVNFQFYFNDSTSFSYPSQ
jgi:hypothetical protein